MKRITSQTLIDATPVQVWKALTDFGGYASWNPLIGRAEGIPRQGQRVVFHVTRADGRVRIYRPWIKSVDWGRTLVLEGRPLLVARLVVAEHVLILRKTPAGRGVCLTQQHEFRGVGAALAFRLLGPWLAPGLAAMNDRLKQRVETAGPLVSPGGGPVPTATPVERRVG